MLPSERDTGSGDLDRPKTPDWSLFAEVGVGDGVCGPLESDNCNAGLSNSPAGFPRLVAAVDKRPDGATFLFLGEKN